LKAIFLDIETDGLDPDMHVALEIACVCVNLHTMECLFEYTSFINCSHREWCFGSDPKALAINGISFEDVKDAPQPSEVCNDLADLFLSYELDKTNSVIICQNPSFDRSFFSQIMTVETQVELDLPYHWLDLASMAWMKLFAKDVKYLDGIAPLSKDNLAQQFGIPPEEKPHRALNGVKHLIECYKALLSFN